MQFTKMHLAVGGAVALVVAIGVSIVLGNLPDGASGSGGEENAAFLYADGQALPDDFADTHPALVADIHAELEARYGLTADRLYDESARPDGLRVVLTLDQALQEAAEETSGEAGVVAVEPGTGAVRCYYGAEAEAGTDLLGSEAPHPPSSVFDMITAATALEAGASIESWWADDDADVTLVEAVRESRTAAMDAVAEEYGVEDVLKTAGSMGLKGIADDEGVLRDVASGDFDGLDAADFGSYPVSVVDMAGVYATIAADGVHADTHFIERVVDGDGRAVEPDQGIRTNQAIADTTAQDLQFTGLGESQAIEDRDFFGVAADFHGETTQSWFVGAIPQLSVAAWANGSAAEDGGMPLWRNVIDTAIEVNGYEAEELPGASGAGTDMTDGIADDDGQIDPDSEYCQANPEVEGCTASESPSESASESETEETSEEPEPDPPTSSSEEEPDPPTTSSEEETTSEDCGWVWC
ncbi:penicillin-binding transpeptidase domain-containing protein [Glycomyces harbinensis]|nr:penicillin-binding transpeptidase domain-containing protein [Glycomyces harbinensis]